LRFRRKRIVNETNLSMREERVVLLHGGKGHGVSYAGGTVFREGRKIIIARKVGNQRTNR